MGAGGGLVLFVIVCVVVTICVTRQLRIRRANDINNTNGDNSIGMTCKRLNIVFVMLNNEFIIIIVRFATTSSE